MQADMLHLNGQHVYLITRLRLLYSVVARAV